MCRICHFNVQDVLIIWNVQRTFWSANYKKSEEKSVKGKGKRNGKEQGEVEKKEKKREKEKRKIVVLHIKQIFSRCTKMPDDIACLEELFLVISQNTSPTTSSAGSTQSLHSGENHMFWLKNPL